MKKLFGDLFIYENILLAYFSDEKQKLYPFLTDKIDIIIDRFLEVFMGEDKQKGTNHVSLIQTIYSNPQFESRSEYFRNLHISNSTLQRYRERYCKTLILILERLTDNLDTKNL